MKPNSHQFTYVSVCFITVVAVAGILVFMSGRVDAAEKAIHEDRIEWRIKDMHAKFKITEAQEAQWAKIVQVMREDAKNMDALTQARVDHAKDMTAVDDLKSYGEIAEAHANGIKKLTPLFADLYANMSDVQKKEADTFFRQGYLEHGVHKVNAKNSGKKSTVK